MSVNQPEGFKVTSTAAGRIPRQRRRLPRPSRVEAIKVDPRIMHAAIQLADGDVRRLQIIDRGESVIVWNKPIRGLGS